MSGSAVAGATRPGSFGTETDLGSGGREEASTSDFGGRRSAPTAPAVARAVQVETRVQLENLASQLTGPTARSVTSLASGLDAVTGGLRNETVEQLLSKATDETTGAFGSRIVRGLTAMINQRGGVMNMRLQPPELGDLRVQMSIAQGTVAAQFTVTSSQAEMLLNRNLAALRSALEGHGLRVERLAVQTTATEPSSSARNDGAADRETDAREDTRHDAGGRESRGRQERAAFAAATRASDADFAVDLGAFAGVDASDHPTALVGVDQS